MLQIPKNINVEISDLDKFGILTQKLEDITAILSDAQTAGDNAIQALGGVDTRAGKAVSDKMVSIDEVEFEKIKVSVANFASSLQKIHNVYNEAEDDFVNAISRVGSDNTNPFSGFTMETK